MINHPLQIAAHSLPLTIEGDGAIRLLVAAPHNRLIAIRGAGQTSVTFDLETQAARPIAPAALPVTVLDGPTLVAGENGQHLLINGTDGQGTARLWACDLEAGRARPIGPTASQLTLHGNGQVWGVCAAPAGAIPPEANPWPNLPRPPLGRLFSYAPGAEQVEQHPEAGPVSLVSAVPGHPNSLFLIGPESLALYDIVERTTLSAVLLAGPPPSAPLNNCPADAAWFALPGGSLYCCSVLPDGEISPTIIADGFGPPERGFFCMPQSGRPACILADGTVRIYDPAARRVLQCSGPPPAGAGPALAIAEDAWYFADRDITRCAVAGAEGALKAALAEGRAEAAAGNLRLTLFHESMHMVLRRADDPALAIEVMLPENVDPHPENYVPAPPRFNWDRSLRGVQWTQGADGWWTLREEQPDFAYLARVRLNDDGVRLDAELTAFNRGEAALPIVLFSPCAGLSGALVDVQHQRTFVVDGQGQLTLLGPLVDEFPYIAATVRGAPDVPHSPLKPRAFRSLDLGLGDNVIIVRAQDGRGTLVMGFEKVYEIGALFVPCVHCEAYVEQVPPGGARTVRGFVAWLPDGDPQAAHAYYRAWRAALTVPGA